MNHPPYLLLELDGILLIGVSYILAFVTVLAQANEMAAPDLVRRLSRMKRITRLVGVGAVVAGIAGLGLQGGEMLGWW